MSEKRSPDASAFLQPPSARKQERPILKIKTPGPLVVTRKSKKTLFRRFKSFLSRLFRTGKYTKPKRRKVAVRKPVIYVYTPVETDVSVAVTLSKDMEFTAVYPIVPIQKLKPAGEKIQWDVHASPNGKLVERKTGLELSSLFWEADLNLRNLPPSNLHSQFDTVPNRWDVSDSNSVVLYIDEVTGYLENALRCLGLHTEARTSFITFWLPSFLNHQFIAIRFISQADYSQIAPLEISPPPDVVTRIFMLFKGVKDAHSWPSARKRAQNDAADWAGIVGVDTAAAFNKDLSRVLEWGAMEITP